MPQQHTCRWSTRSTRVELLLTRLAAGTPAQALATEHALSLVEVIAIGVDHGLSVPSAAAGRRQGLGPWARTCRPGDHRCFWADRGEVIDALIGDYADGASLIQLSRAFPYSRATAARILDAHDVPRRSRSEQCTRIPLDLETVQAELDADMSLTEVAARHGLSRQMLRRRLNRAKAAA
ncbi:hypothetical protein [Streptacidiphilus jiangxiensis]|nr:hypothetical protein [Streptacidiphilus jiangxiensis]